MPVVSEEDLRVLEAKLRLGFKIHEAATWRIDGQSKFPGTTHLFLMLPGHEGGSTCGRVLYFDSLDMDSTLLTMAESKCGDQSSHLVWCAECLEDGFKIARCEDPVNESALFGVEIP